jgi:hypothetical protein
MPLRGRQKAQEGTWYRFRSKGGDALRGRSPGRPARAKETPSMLADFEDVLDKLEVASRNGEKAMSFCPAHDDCNNPSLSLKAENGKLLMHCFAGCRPEDIVSEIGLQMKDLFSEGGGGPLSPRACLHACTLRAKTRIPIGKASVQVMMHALSTVAHLKSTPKRRSYRSVSCVD